MVKDHFKSLESLLNIVVGFSAILALAVLLFDRSHYSVPYSNIINGFYTGVMILFISDVIIRIMIDKDPVTYIKGHWYSFIVFMPLFQETPFRGEDPYSIILKQIIILIMIISRLRKDRNLISNLSLHPARLMIMTFFLTICMGTVILTLPMSTTAGTQTSLVDAMFTSTSALCVTGLIVQDTATWYNTAGQATIAILIQLGGLGIMTFSVFLALVGGKRMSIKDRTLVGNVLDYDTLSDAFRVILFIFKLTFTVELIGTIGLIIAWRDFYPTWGQTIYHSVFHSISAFCNAGFSTNTDSMMPHQYDLTTNFVMASLIIIGGLGFLALRNITSAFRTIFTGKKRHIFLLKVQTRLVLRVTFILIIVGMAGIYFFERQNFANVTTGQALLLSFFQSVTTRTAGFNTALISSMSSPTLLLIIILMFIGASPGSTGGGIKTTTFAVLFLTMFRGVTSKNNIEVMKRTISLETIQKALTVLLFYITFVFAILLALLYIEPFPFMSILFETISAVGTVGLSTGITADLSNTGKILIMILMFVGRLGPLTVGYALVFGNKPQNYAYAEERIMIG
jgi:trk system potassium uptake protein TrkH